MGSTPVPTVHCLTFATSQIYSALLDGQVQNALTTADGYAPNLYHDIRPFILAIPIIHAVAAVILAYFTWKLFQDFGWEVLHLLGADRKLKRRYTYYLVHLCLLKFDVSLVCSSCGWV